MKFILLFLLLISCKKTLYSSVNHEYVNALIEGDNIVRFIDSYYFENGTLPDSLDINNNYIGSEKLVYEWIYKVSGNKKMCYLGIKNPINGNFIYLHANKRIISSRKPIEMKMINWERYR